MSFTEDKQLKGLADAAGKILDESLSIYELVTKLSKDESNEFMGAAAAAKKAGKKSFEFGGKTYPVKMGDEVANKILDMKMHDEEEDETEDIAELLSKVKFGHTVVKEEEEEDEEEEVSETRQAEFVSQSAKKENGDVVGIGEEMPYNEDEIEVKDGEAEEAEEPEVKKEAVENKGNGASGTENLPDEEDDGIEGSKKPAIDMDDAEAKVSEQQPRQAEPVGTVDTKEEDGVEGAEEADTDVEENKPTEAETPKGEGGAVEVPDEEDGIEGTEEPSKKVSEAKHVKKEDEEIDEEEYDKNEEDKEDIDEVYEDEEEEDEEVSEAMKSFERMMKVWGEAKHAKKEEMDDEEDGIEGSAPINKDVKESHIMKAIGEAIAMKEGKMKELHGHIEDGKSAEEIIKAMRLKKTPDMVKFIQGLMKK